MDKTTSRAASSPSGVVASNRSVYSVFEFLNIPIPEWPLTSPVVMLIVVAILLFVLAFVYKQATQPELQQHSQNLSEKYRLYMAGSMAGEYVKRTFNAWTSSRQDSTGSSNRDEKSKRDTTSSSFSTSPRSPSSSQLPSNRRQARKPPGSVSSVDTFSLVDDIPVFSSRNTSSDENSPIPIESEESKSTFTINVSEPVSTRTVVSPHKANKIRGTIPGECSDRKNESSNSQQRFSLINSHLNDGNNDDVTCRPPNMSSGSKSSNEQQSRNQLDDAKSTVMIDLPQESDGEVESIISDDHSEFNMGNGTSPAPIKKKSSTELIQDERSDKPTYKKRRRRARSKNKQHQKQHQNPQSEQQSEQRTLKQDQPAHLSKHEHSPQSSSELPRSRHLGDHARSPNYAWQKPSRQSQVHSQQYHLQSQRSQVLNDSDFYPQTNKRAISSHSSHNTNGVSISPIRPPLQETNKKSSSSSNIRSDPHWRPNVPAASHVSISRSNSVPSPSMGSRFSYADVISPINSRSAFSRSPQISRTSLLPNTDNITTPAPTASVASNDDSNNQWYSPFSSGLSIQLTQPATTQISHDQLLSENETSSPSTFSFFSSQTRYQSDVRIPSQISTPLKPPSSFSYPPPFSNSHVNNPPTSPSNASFSESFFSRRNLSDRERNRPSEKEDATEAWGSNIVGNKGESEGHIERQQRQRKQQSSQFSFFDKRVSFLSPSASE